jgi:hypothetical protein
MICRTCAHSTTAPGHQSMYRLGYRNCAHKPDYVFVPGGMKCNLNPIRWMAKA